MTDARPIQLQSESPEETIRIAATLGRSLCAPVVVTLAGPLGAGKTQFVRGLAAGLGADEDRVSSPTFVLCQEYAAADATLVHIDAYRMRSPDELDTIGWDELLRADNLIIAIEWPERIAAALPNERIDVTLQPRGPNLRAIEIRSSDGHTDELSGDGNAARSEEAAATVNCRTCGNEMAASGENYPFCSERCRLADLGRWFSGGYTISRELEEDDLWRS